MSRDPITYTVFWQRMLFLIAGASFLALAIWLIQANPYNLGLISFQIFLFNLWVWLSSVFILLFFWWVFSLKKEILEIPQVNNLIYQGVVVAAVIIWLLTLHLSGQITYWHLLGAVAGFKLYQWWLRL